MGFLADLRYFGPALGSGRGTHLALAKIRKAIRKRRLARRLGREESAAHLFERLGLPSESGARLALLRESWTLWGQSSVLAPVPGPLDAASDSLNSAPASFSQLEAEARAILSGRQRLFGQSLEVGWPPRWDWRWNGTENASPFSRDVRSTWELQRLQGLLPLTAPDLSGPQRETYAAAYLEALADFSRAHPGPGGLAWASALEVALRLVSLVQGLPRIVGTQAFAAREEFVLRFLDRQARWLAADLSLDKAVRGNHLLGELAGLLAVGHLLPSARAAWWGGRDVRGVLESEILRQFHADGVSVEQSLPYEAFILQFLTVAGETARLRDEPFSSAVRKRLAAAADHLEAVLLPGGEVPKVGDCDSGRGACLGASDPHRPGLTLSRVRNMAQGNASGGDSRPTPGVRVLRTAGGSTLTHFPSGGHAVLRSPLGDFLFLRGGPFGWGIPGPASHSHADWLAPVLVVGGEPLLVDPGVYGYDVGETVRDAQRIWSAHGGIRPGAGRGPRPAGLFRWTDLEPTAGLEVEAKAGTLEVRGWVRWTAPRPPLLWQRSIHYNELRREWILRDRVEGGLGEGVEWGFLFAPTVTVVKSDRPGIFHLDMPSGARHTLRLVPPGPTRLESGTLSSSYGHREPGVVLVRGLEAGCLEAHTEIRTGVATRTPPRGEREEQA